MGGGRVGTVAPKLRWSSKLRRSSELGKQLREMWRGCVRPGSSGPRCSLSCRPKTPGETVTPGGLCPFQCQAPGLGSGRRGAPSDRGGRVSAPLSPRRLHEASPGSSPTFWTGNRCSTEGTEPQAGPTPQGTVRGTVHATHLGRHGGQRGRPAGKVGGAKGRLDSTFRYMVGISTKPRPPQGTAAFLGCGYFFRERAGREKAGGRGSGLGVCTDGRWAETTHLNAPAVPNLSPRSVTAGPIRTSNQKQVHLPAPWKAPGRCPLRVRVTPPTLSQASPRWHTPLRLFVRRGPRGRTPPGPLLLCSQPCDSPHALRGTTRSLGGRAAGRLPRNTARCL